MDLSKTRRNRTMTKTDMTIRESQKIIAEYTTRLTVRQIYYRLVTNGIIKNRQSEYKFVSAALVKARLEGAISWDAIEDRTRAFLAGDHDYAGAQEHFDGWLQAFKDCGDDYRLPYWFGQPTLVEVWEEKQALQAVFSEIARNTHVQLGVCKGYPSISYLKEAADRISAAIEAAPEERGCWIEQLTIVYFGDFDPSGCDIERNIRERLTETFDLDIHVERFALTENQIAEYNLPPMPAKTTDSRTAKHVAEFGTDSAVELDALDPKVLNQTIHDAIMSHWDTSQEIADDRLKMQTERQAEINELIDSVLKKKARRNQG